MSDTEKLCIKQLDDKSDYSLWKIRVEATCSDKGVADALTKSKDGTPFYDDHKKTTSIIVAELWDCDSYFLWIFISDAMNMFEKLDARFYSRSTGTKIFKIS